MAYIYLFFRKIISLNYHILNYLYKVLYFFQSFHTGVFIGLLRRNDLSTIDISNYNRWKQYYNDDYNKKPLHTWEKELVETHFKHCKTIVVTAAGGGREVYNLAKLGFDVTGFEYNEKMRNYANNLLKKENIAAQILPIERDKAPHSNQIFDAAVIGMGSYIHIKGKKQRIEFLKEMCKLIHPGGKLLVSFYPMSFAYMNLNRIYKIGNFIARLTKNEKVEKGDSLDVEFIHYFTKEEIYNELENAGLTVLQYGETQFGHAVATP